MRSHILLLLLLIATPIFIKAQQNDIVVVTNAGHILTDYTISPDEQYLMTYCSKSVALWNLNTMQIIRILPKSLTDARFGPGNPLIVYIQNDKNDKYYEGYNILTGDFVGTKNQNSLMPHIKECLRYRFEYGQDDKSILVYDRKTNYLFNTLRCNEMPSLGKIDITDNDSLLLLTGMYPQIWNLKKARLESKIPLCEYIISNNEDIGYAYKQIPMTKTKLSNERVSWKDWCKGCFSANNSIILGGYNDITTWSLDGTLINTQTVEGNPVYDWVDYNGYRYVATWNGGLQVGKIEDDHLYAVGNSTHMNFISDIMADGHTFYSGNEYLLRGDINHKDLLYSIRWIADYVNSDVSLDKKKVLLSGELGHVEEMNINGDSLMFQYKSYPVSLLSRTNSARYLQDEKHIVAGFSNGAIAMWRLREIYPYWSTTAHRGNVMDLLPTNTGSFFISSGSDGWCRIYDWEKCEEVVAMYSPEGSRDYLFLTPDYYYKGTKDIFDEIHFAYGTETFGFDQFDLKYNRPDIILQRMGGDPKEIDIMYKAWLKRVKKMGFTPEQLSEELHVPECKILNETEMPLFTTDRNIHLELYANDSKYNIERLLLYLNGVPIFSRHGLNISDMEITEYKMDYDLQLASGQNEITFSCLNEKGVESYRHTITIFQQETEPLPKPDLYLVSLGISEYKQSENNLTYAAKDAIDFTQLMNSLLKERFSNINTICLTDSEVNLEGLNRILNCIKQSRRDDVVMFYYAGHGLLDDQLDYYLCTYETDFNNPRQKGIPYEQIEDWFDSIASLNRCCFIDACHSGEFDKDDFVAESRISIPEGKITFRNAALTQREVRQGIQQVNTLVEDLFIETRWGIGATIISSSGGLEASMESDEWKNGLFTWCIKKGMTNLNADNNRDGNLTVGELIDYLKNEVNRMSEGKQQPTLRSGKNRMNDYILVQ